MSNSSAIKVVRTYCQRKYLSKVEPVGIQNACGSVGVDIGCLDQLLDEKGVGDENIAVGERYVDVGSKAEDSMFVSESPASSMSGKTVCAEDVLQDIKELFYSPLLDSQQEAREPRNQVKNNPSGGKEFSYFQPSFLQHSFDLNAAWPSSFNVMGLSNGFVAGVGPSKTYEMSGTAKDTFRGLLGGFSRGIGVHEGGDRLGCLGGSSRVKMREECGGCDAPRVNNGWSNVIL